MTEEIKVTDNRRIDPKTGEARVVAAETATPAAAASTEPAESALVEDAKVAELTADLQRLQAEYQNYRKRVERDREAQRDLVLVNALAEFLPILDDISRARAHDELQGAFRSIGEAFENTVTRLGLRSFGEPGDVFDPTRHEAIKHEHSDEVTGPTCVAVFQAGYEFNGRIVRAAVVSVAEPN